MISSPQQQRQLLYPPRGVPEAHRDSTTSSRRGPGPRRRPGGCRERTGLRSGQGAEAPEARAPSGGKRRLEKEGAGLRMSAIGCACASTSSARTRPAGLHPAPPPAGRVAAAVLAPAPPPARASLGVGDGNCTMPAVTGLLRWRHITRHTDQSRRRGGAAERLPRWPRTGLEHNASLQGQGPTVAAAAARRAGAEVPSRRRAPRPRPSPRKAESHSHSNPSGRLPI